MEKRATTNRFENSGAHGKGVPTRGFLRRGDFDIAHLIFSCVGIVTSGILLYFVFMG